MHNKKQKLSEYIPFKKMDARKEGENTIIPVHEYIKDAGFPLEKHLGARLIKIPSLGGIPPHEHKPEDTSMIFVLRGSGFHNILKDGQIIEQSEIKEEGIVLHPGDILQNGLSHEFDAGEDGLDLLVVYDCEIIKDEELLKIHKGEEVYS